MNFVAQGLNKGLWMAAYSGALWCLLACTHSNSVGEAPNYRTVQSEISRNQVDVESTAAIENIQSQAQQGHAASQYVLGRLHFYGQGGVQQDQQQALKWFDAAAKQNDARGQYAAGFVRVITAVKTFIGGKNWNSIEHENIDQSVEYRMKLMMQLLKPQVSKGIALIQKSAQQKNHQALFALGTLSCTGWLKDNNAKKYFDALRKNSHPISDKMYVQGVVFRFIGSKRLNNNMMTCFSFIAHPLTLLPAVAVDERDEMPAAAADKINPAVMAQTVAQATRELEAFKKHPSSYVKFALSELYQNPHNPKKNSARAFTLLQQAAQENSAEAQHRLALKLKAQGQHKQAHYWLERAVHQGHLKSLDELIDTLQSSQKTLNLHKFLGENKPLHPAQAEYIYKFAKHKLLSRENYINKLMWPKLYFHATNFVFNSNLNKYVFNQSAQDRKKEEAKKLEDFAARKLVTKQTGQLAVKFVHYVQKAIQEKVLQDLKHSYL